MHAVPAHPGFLTMLFDLALRELERGPGVPKAIVSGFFALVVLGSIALPLSLPLAA